MRSNIPGVYFNGIAQPSDDFQAVRSGARSMPLQFDVDLASARTFAAGTQANIELAGNFLYVDQKANSGNCTVHFQDQNDRAVSVTLLPGMLWRVPFTKIAIENTAQAGASMRFIYGVDIDALPISAAGVTVLNAISIVDAGRAAAVAGSAFWNFGPCANVAASLAHVQLFNPAASGKRLIVRAIDFYTSAADTLYLGFYNVALATSSRAGLSKLSGGAVGVGLAKTEALAAAVLTAANAFTELAALANTPDRLVLADPIVLLEGKGLAVANRTVNLALRVGFEYTEESL